MWNQGFRLGACHSRYLLSPLSLSFFRNIGFLLQISIDPNAVPNNRHMKFRVPGLGVLCFAVHRAELAKSLVLRHFQYHCDDFSLKLYRLKSLKTFIYV